jgi:hypothetical protein
MDETVNMWPFIYVAASKMNEVGSSEQENQRQEAALASPCEGINKPGEKQACQAMMTRARELLECKEKNGPNRYSLHCKPHEVAFLAAAYRFCGFD